MNKIKKADILVIFIIVLTSFFIYFFTNKLPKDHKNSSKKVVITVDGKIFKEVSLNKDTDIRINSQYGNNVVHIENGEVQMFESDCKDKICMKMGKISLNGDSIICLPNRLMVKIIDDAPDDESLDMIIK
ncbi:NusG domain II-containing protein [Peptoniphilus phoceensis]|uniref:NusG domain II-containing protein n=1 Tax=Peptoniphilus phoceensis TaxID=1720298 RepID=UPI000A9A0A3B|nr:NusG domain II-containing protein [Peptoniphilus phoceensis]